MATADWNPLGEVYFKKSELYCMEWADLVDLDKYMIAVAPYGGPIALIRDDRKIVRTQSTSKPELFIYTAVGKKISQMRWNNGNVIDIGWSDSEDLLCVQDDGAVLVYSIFCNFKRTFSMGQEAKDTKVIDCRIFSSYQGTGVAVLTSSYRFFMVNNVDDPRIRRLAEVPGLQSAPSSWAILNVDRQSRALVAKDAELYLLDHGGQYQAQDPPGSPVGAYTEMAVSFNNKCLALFSDTGILWIGSSDLKKKYCEFNTKSQQRPQQLAWCGTGAVVAFFENLMIVVGPDKDWIRFTYDGPIHLTQEIDGLRIIGNYSHEFLHRIPVVTEQIFKIGSMSAGAMLFDASKEFQKGSQKADEYIRMIRDQLTEAVEICIQAAGQELEISLQKQLLRAASFGKCFLTDYKPDAFVNMCQMLRVLNAVRDHNIGIGITYNQLEHLTVTVLIDRLVLRKLFPHAKRICQFLKIPDSEGASRILAHWACYKVQTSADDESIAQAIAQKLGDTPGVSYSEIANKAIEVGKAELAIRLLDFEPKAAEQVPLLLKMNRDSLALTKAIESGDSDLVYTVLLRLKDNLSNGEFLLAIRNMPAAYALFHQYCRHQNRKMLQDLLYQEDKQLEIANCKVIDSYDEDRFDGKLTCLKAASEGYTRAKSEFAARQTEEQLKLLKIQRVFEEDFNKQYVDLSLHQTVYKLIKDNLNKPAETLRKDFKVPDRRYWWLRISALAESEQWLELEKFSRSKKSPIGLEPFVEVCLKYGNRFEAIKYIPKLPPENRVRAYVKCDKLPQAAECAIELKSESDMKLVLSKCGPMDRATADKLKDALGGKR